MKTSFVTPIDIKYSHRATEKLVYEYARYLKKHGLESEVLVPNYIIGKVTLEARNAMYDKYNDVSTTVIKGVKIRLPFKYDVYYFSQLPKGDIIYLPYSLYTHILNIILKPARQKYVIGSHGMHIKEGRMLYNYNFIEDITNFFVRSLILSRRDIKENVFYHVINLGQKNYLKGLGIDEKKILYVPNFIDPDKFKIKINHDKALRVLHVGGIDKNAAMMVDIIDKLRREDLFKEFKFYFIGKEEPDEVLEYERTYDNISYMGFVDKENVKAKIFSEMDLMVVPDIETFSVTMIEGMASGLAIVSRNNDIVADLRMVGAEVAEVRVSDGVEGYISILKEMLNAKRHGKFDREFRLKNRKLVIKHFSRDKVLKEFKRSLDQITSK